MSLYRFFKDSVTPMANAIAPIGKQATLATFDTLTGGYISSGIENVGQVGIIEKEKEITEKQIDLTKQQSSLNWNMALRNASIASRQRSMQAESINEQVRAGAISEFQQESAAVAASGTSGITGGTPYMAIESSLGETQRQLRTWFKQAREGMEISGEQSSMNMESARFDQKAGQLDLDKLRLQSLSYGNQIESFNESYSPLNMGLAIVGGTMSAVADMYTIGTNVGAIGKMAGISDFSFDAMNKLANTDWLKVGTDYRFAQATGTTMDFNNLNAPNNKPGLISSTLNMFFKPISIGRY